MIKKAQRRGERSRRPSNWPKWPRPTWWSTNPTHIAVALRYDRKTMKAPKVVAKGIRLNAQQIREIAIQHQVPIMENKPLARCCSSTPKWAAKSPPNSTPPSRKCWRVYRINRYRYFSERNQT